MGRSFLFVLPFVFLAGPCFAQSPLTLSEKDEMAIGRAAAAEVDRESKLVDDPAITSYVSALGNRLVAKSTRPDIQYTFRVVDSPEVNAFALPGGYIYVNRGLIEKASSEDELAGVLSHEIAHVAARHGAEQAARANLVQNGIGALSEILGRGTGGNFGQTAAQMVANGVFLKFSRDAERKADEMGARMMIDAGYPPKGMVSFFERLETLQQTAPNVVQRFFSSHPSPEDRAQNISRLVADAPASSRPAASAQFAAVQRKLADLPRPELELARRQIALDATAQPIAEVSPEVRSRNLARDREIASKLAPVLHQALGPAPRFDLVTNFDFDGDWRGDNNWNDAADPSFRLKAYVYYAVTETRTHYFVHYAFFHPRDYKGGDRRGATLSEAIRAAVVLGGKYDPTGRADEAVLAHENDLEGALIVAAKNGNDPGKAKVVAVETLAHNAFLKYTPKDHAAVELFAEGMGHGVEPWTGDEMQRRSGVNGFLTYKYKGKAEDPDANRGDSIGYDLIPFVDTLWPRAMGGRNGTFGEEHNYGLITIHTGEASTERTVRVGVAGSAFFGEVGAPNMARPPWGWFDAEDKTRPLGEWFLKPAETIRRKWNMPDTFSTDYVYQPFLGFWRQ